MTRTDETRRILAQQVAWSDKLLRAAVLMALYLRGYENPPKYFAKDIDFVRQTFNVPLERWE
jgi:hypothetical protein